MFFNGNFNYVLIDAEDRYYKELKKDDNNWKIQSYTVIREQLKEEIHDWDKFIKEGRVATKIRESPEEINKIIDKEYQAVLSVLNMSLILSEKLRRYKNKRSRGDKSDKYKR